MSIYAGLDVSDKTTHTGWFKRVHMKASATHIDRAALRIRAQLITTRVAMGNQLRGLLKLCAATFPRRAIRCSGDHSTSCCAACSAHLHFSNGASALQNRKATSVPGSRLPANWPCCSIRYG